MRPLAVRSRSRLDVLLAAAGYTQILGGPSELAAQIYQSPPNSDLLPIEFLAPLTGRRQQATIQIQKGVTAQALRYLNILLENTFDVRLSAEAVAGYVGELTVRIPIPGAYVFHRGLISAPGGSQRRGKDLYYIFETWASLSNLRSQIAEEVGELRVRYPRPWYLRFRSTLESLFPNSAGEGVLLVFQQYEAREPREIAHQRIYHAFGDLLRAVPSD